MKCSKCGKEIPNDSLFCTYCRARTNVRGVLLPTANNKYPIAYHNDMGIKCPNCFSNDLQIITRVTSSGIDGQNAALWGGLTCLLCGPVCGLFSSLWNLNGSNATRTDAFWVCKHCGNKFRV